MSDEVYLQIHAALEQVQRAEPHHGQIGSVDKDGARIPIDLICRDCSSRRPCWKISLVLGDLGSGRLTDEQALAVVEDARR